MDYLEAKKWYTIFYNTFTEMGLKPSKDRLVEIGRRLSRTSNAIAEVSSGAVVCSSWKGAIRSVAVERNPYAAQSDDCLTLPNARYATSAEHLNGGISKVMLTGSYIPIFTVSHNISE